MQNCTVIHWIYTGASPFVLPGESISQPALSLLHLWCTPPWLIILNFWSTTEVFFFYICTCFPFIQSFATKLTRRRTGNRIYTGSLVLRLCCIMSTQKNRTVTNQSECLHRVMICCFGFMLLLIFSFLWFMCWLTPPILLVFAFPKFILINKSLGLCFNVLVVLLCIWVSSCLPNRDTSPSSYLCLTSVPQQCNASFSQEFFFQSFEETGQDFKIK